MSKIDPAPAMAGAAARAMNSTDWSLLFVLSVFWGGSFLFNGFALREVPVLSIVAFRVTLGALALHVMLRLWGIAFPLTRRALAGYLGMAILNSVVPFSLIVYGQLRIPSGLASILNATVPIYTMLLAHFLVAGEALTGRRIVGVLLGFAGVVLLSSEKIAAGSGELIGFLACLGAAFSYGLSNVFAKRFLPPGANPIALAAGQLSVAALIVLPATLLLERPFEAGVPGAQALFGLFMLAFVSTAAAYVVFFRILSRTGATGVSLVTLLIPCWSILLGAVFLEERLGGREIGGFAIIALGLLVIDGRLAGAAKALARRA